MLAETKTATGGNGGGGAGLNPANLGDEATPIVIAKSQSVKKTGRALLIDQAQAAAERAEATAAWHRERAGRYLAWCDMAWCAAQFAQHTSAAAFQEAIAARHRAVQVALLQGVRHE